MNCYVVVGNGCKGVYSNFENALNMAKAYQRSTGEKLRIQTIKLDKIDWELVNVY